MLHSRPLFLSVALAFILALVYFRLPQLDFVNIDDGIHTHRNPNLTPLTWEGVKQLWIEPYRKLYIPVSYMVWGMLSTVHPIQDGKTQFDPWIYHLFNLLLHITTTVVLVFPILIRITGSRLGAFWGALLFGLHPVQVESVAWISGLKDVLSNALALLSLRFYLWSYDLKDRRAFALCLIAYLFSTLAKPSTVVMPLIFVIIDHFFLDRSWRAQGKDYAVLGIVTLPVLWITTVAQASQALEFTIPTVPQRLVISIDALLFYAQKIGMPYPLILDYGRTPEWVLRQDISWNALRVASFIAVALGLWISRQRWLVGCALLFVAAQLPTLGLKPFVFQLVSTVADRYLYLPLFAVGLALAFAYKKWQEQPWMQVMTPALITGAAILTFNQTKVWTDSYRLFTHALQHNPDSWLAHNNLGVVYEADKQLDRALYHYVRSGELRPNTTVYNNVGAVSITLKRYPEALTAFRQALRMSPREAMLYNNIGTVYLAQGDPNRAKTYFVRALELDPALKEARENLERIRQRIG